MAIIPLQRKHTEDVRNHGTVGDGVTDDTAAIRAAFTAANAVPGGATVYFPAGTYLVNPIANTASPSGLKNAFELGANVTVELAAGAQLTVSADAAAVDQYAIFYIEDKSNWSIISHGSSLLRGDADSHTGSTGEGGHLIHVVGGSNWRIEGVRGSYAWGDGIYLDGSPNNWTIRSCRFDTCRRNGISVVSGTYGLIEGCYINQAGKPTSANGVGIDLETNPGASPVTHVMVRNNHVRDCAGTGIVCLRPEVSFCSIIGNHLEGNDQWAITINRSSDNVISGNVLVDNTNGISVESDSVGFEAKRNLVTGNRVKDSGVSIRIYNAGDGATDNTVTGNVINASAGTIGIHIFAADRNLVADNRLGLGTVTYGVHVEGTTSRDNVVQGNSITGPTYGIRVNQAPRTLVSGNKITSSKQHSIYLDGERSSAIGNMISAGGTAAHNTYDGIYVDANADYCTIQGNHVYHGGGAVQFRYGINVIAGVTSAMVTNNDLLDAGATADFNDAGTTTVTAAGNRT